MSSPRLCVFNLTGIQSSERFQWLFLPTHFVLPRFDEIVRLVVDGEGANPEVRLEGLP